MARGALVSRLAKLLLVLTGFSPVLITHAFVLWIRDRFHPWGWVLLAITCLLVIICALLLRAARMRLGRVPIQVEALKTADKELLGFLLSYVLPLANASAPQVDARVLGFVLVLLVTVVWTTHAYHFNPLLGLLGYHFFEVATKDKVTYVLLTRKNLTNGAGVTSVVMLTDYILLDASEV